MGDSVGKMWVESLGMLLGDLFMSHHLRTKKNDISAQKHELRGVKTQLGHLSTSAKETKAGVDNVHSKLSELASLLRPNTGKRRRQTQREAPQGFTDEEESGS